MGIATAKDPEAGMYLSDELQGLQSGGENGGEDIGDEEGWWGWSGGLVHRRPSIFTPSEKRW